MTSATPSPWTLRSSANRLTPPPWATFIAASAAVLLVGVAFGSALWSVAGVAGLAMIISGISLAHHWSGAVTVTRTIGRRECEVGQTIDVTLRLTNRSKLPVIWLLVEDLLPRAALSQQPPAIAVAGERLQLCYLRGGQTRQLAYRMHFRRRGCFQIGPLVAETGDLMGLYRRHRVHAGSDVVLVFPAVVPLGGYDIASPRPLGEIRIQNALAEDPTRLRGIRPWRVGDSLRRVHWAATARTGTLHSKLYEPTSMAGATLVLDLHQDTNPPHHEPLRSDLTVTLAASIAHFLYEQGQPVGLLSNGRDAAERIRSAAIGQTTSDRETARTQADMQASSDRWRPICVTANRGPAHYQDLRRQFARLELSDGLSLIDTLFESLPQLSRETTLVVIAQRCDQASAAALLSLKQQGWMIKVIINTQDINDFIHSAGTLQANRIEVAHLGDEHQIASVARRLV